MKIRLFTMEDYDAVYQLWTNSTGIGLRSLDDSREGIQKFLQRNPETNYIAQVDNKVAGVILCGHDGRRGYIYHAAVDAAYRRRGIGKKLVSAVIESLIKEDINKVAILVFAANDAGNNFWQSLGFEKKDDLVYRSFAINDDNI